MLIAQLSDPHVRPEGVRYQGVVDSNAGLHDAIDRLLTLDRQPELILLTGDLVDEGRPEEYEQLRKILVRLEIPLLVIPGNHDDRDHLRAAFTDHHYLPARGPLHFCIDEYPVRIIGLDSTVPGLHHGHLDRDALDWLADTLAADASKPTVLMLHHPPFVSDIPYLDQYRYFQGADLKAVVERADNVELVLCGHVHRSMLKRWAGTVVCTCPSTATEIDLRLAPSAEPSSHGGPRGFMLHRWDEGEGMLSHTVQLGEFPGPYPFA